MSSDEVHQTPTTTPRGWYADPNVPGQDRWWDGTAWTKFTHRANTMRVSMFGVSYGRAFWAGANVAARRSLLIARIDFIGFIVVFFVTGVAAKAGSLSPGVAGATTFALVVVAFAAAVVGIVLGVVGVRRAPVLGATLVAAWGLGLSILVLLVTGGFLVALLVKVLAR